MTEVQATAGTDISPLLQPLQVGQLRLANRFVMPGMQRAWCVDGAPDRRLREYYRRRALGGTALVVCEACAVDHPSAASNPMFARLDASTAGAWRACVEEVHEAGGRIFIQLWHQGAVDTGKAGPDFTALSPSGLEKAGKSFGRPATAAELAEIIEAFARCAVIAREIGADGVEVHACHGYLLDQFLWPETNKRADDYGGASIASRAAFPAEVVTAVRAVVGPGYPISVRISQWKEADYEAKIVSSPAELGQLVSILRSAGTDLFHVSTRRFWTPEWPGSDLGLAGWAKSFTDAPVIAVGSVGLDIDVMATLTGEEARPTGDSRIADLVRRFERGDFDLVSIGRSLIGDPDWVAKMRDGRGAEIRPFRRTDLQWLSLPQIASPAFAAGSAVSLSPAAGHTCVERLSQDGAFDGLFCVEIAIYNSTSGASFVTTQIEISCPSPSGQAGPCFDGFVDGQVANGAGNITEASKTCTGGCTHGTNDRTYLFPFGGLPVPTKLNTCDANVWGNIIASDTAVDLGGSDFAEPGSNLATPHYNVCLTASGFQFNPV